MPNKSQTGRGFFYLTRCRLLWTCLIIGLMAGVVIYWLFGIGLWPATAFLFLIACPLVVAWILVIERQEKRKPRNPQ